ncbi:hypothetical protein N692_04280 [Lactiplantibacillus plantarum EGD-AQ4]|nr:hypothetical protein N692_04280 [Lactiplantibacillus plantarum EGD-AQ4]
MLRHEKIRVSLENLQLNDDQNKLFLYLNLDLAGLFQFVNENTL